MPCPPPSPLPPPFSLPPPPLYKCIIFSAAPNWRAEQPKPPPPSSLLPPPSSLLPPPSSLLPPPFGPPPLPSRHSVWGRSITALTAVRQSKKQQHCSSLSAGVIQCNNNTVAAAGIPRRTRNTGMHYALVTVITATATATGLTHTGISNPQCIFLSSLFTSLIQCLQ